MEKHGLIKRKVYSYEKPVRVEYLPTEKGIALQPILDAMAAYSLKYPRGFKEVYGKEINFH